MSLITNTTYKPYYKLNSNSFHAEKKLQLLALLNQRSKTVYGWVTLKFLDNDMPSQTSWSFDFKW